MTVESNLNESLMSNASRRANTTILLDPSNHDDATWILTSAFIIFTMQSGKSTYLYFGLIRCFTLLRSFLNYFCYFSVRYSLTFSFLFIRCRFRPLGKRICVSEKRSKYNGKKCRRCHFWRLDLLDVWLWLSFWRLCTTVKSILRMG